MLPVFIVSAVFIFVLFITKMAMDHTTRVKEIERSEGGNSLRASELKALIAEAVSEATGPLDARVARLEEHLEHPGLPPADESRRSRLTSGASPRRSELDS